MRLLGTAALQKLKNAAKFHVSTFPASFEIFGISGMVGFSTLPFVLFKLSYAKTPVVRLGGDRRSSQRIVNWLAVKFQLLILVHSQIYLRRPLGHSTTLLPENLTSAPFIQLEFAL